MSIIGSRNAIFFGLFDHLLKYVSAGLETFARARKLRRSRAVTKHLLTHDDRMLDDMGVSRNDVKQALSVAWDRDPAAALAEIRRRRIQADRQGLVHRRAD